MSPRFRPQPSAAAHERARELAALHLDGPLPPDDAAWLADHLAGCAACRAVAAEYDDQRTVFRTLRQVPLEAPRDLWARTAAAMEVEAGRRRGRRRRRGIALTMAPLAGVLVVAIAVSAGLLNGNVLFPLRDSTIKGDDLVLATPIALVAGDIQVLSPSVDGSVSILSRQLDEVCPIEADSCGLQPNVDVTQVAGLTTTSNLDAIISPDRGQLVVVERGSGTQGVYVVPVEATTTPTESASPAPTPVVADSASPEATPSASPSASLVATPTASPVESGSPSAAPSPSDAAPPTPATSPTTSAEPSPEAASSEPSEPPTPTPTPTVEVTPGPDGAVEIAHDVVVVRSMAGYSPSGKSFGFAARPADGSTGPDVYVWRVGDAQARAVTTDHESLYSGWLGERLLISRVVGGIPVTVALDPDTGSERAAHNDAMWRPTVGPDDRTAVWWDGSVRRAEGDVPWVPDTGRLILAAWPDGGRDAQVLAGGPVTDWEVRWDETGSAMAVWIGGDAPDAPGTLSLYPFDAATGRADVANPMLRDAVAFGGFSLREGRLAWATPEDGGDTSVQVLAWSGDTVGKVTLPTESGATVIR